MWDYGFAIPSCIIIFIVLCFYFSLPRLALRKNIFYVMILIVESLVISADIFSSWADDNISILPLVLVDYLNASYFALFFARALAMFYFIASYFKLIPEKNDVKTLIINIPFGVGFLLSITSPFTGLIYSVRKGFYESGPLYNIIYFVYAYYMILCYIILYRFKYRIKRRRHYWAVFYFVAVLTVGIILRRLMPHLLLMDTFCLIAILIIYLATENPEFYLETRGAVFNSAAFRDLIEERIGREHFSVLCVVIKNYHEMRDIYGGQQIDDGLILISQYLTRNFKELSTFYYRNGRFLLLGSNDMDYQNYVEQIRSRFVAPWKEEGVELYLEPGFAFIDVGEKVALDVLLNTLTVAFNKVETRSSSDILVFSEEELREKEDEMALKRFLETAVERDKVEVFLQPLVKAESGGLISAEALCRIRDDEGKLIPPGLFIPIAEANGKINQLGEQVFVKTCQFIKDNDINKMGLSRINVNLSPVQFLKTDLADRYASIMKKYDIDPGMIYLEITEESLIDDGFLHRQIESMKNKGFQFVLDDYGTGYSNIARLKKCPFINVKLDMSIVRDYFREPDDILPSMIQAFKHMGFGVTAEGIEDEDMAAVMTKVGCDYLQGYYYSKPLPMNEFVEKYSV
ncbi:EAL domain-containing protein [Butyrivibrio sp. CB08]|uniref:EAL domain-containing protein n=1 Tax=Butyrivibrio sp. CB08 TaxID=2364879 RepID=UPI000EAAA9F6|nr:EAL domain-containing protein [Butyrivibrio sp. CB08]RKM61034.1 EAL domain-containing protein [Butyrivibrio sp. CB08]